MDANSGTENHLQLSGHICGKWVKDALIGKWPKLDDVTDMLGVQFQRFQLNTHAQPHRYSEGFFKLVDKLSGECQTVIFQLDGKDGSQLARAAVEWCGNQANIAGLFDLSHGAGILPSEWPEPVAGLLCGYAGGLGQDNIADQLDKIKSVASIGSWVDAEAKLRNDTTDAFDLDKVAKFLEACEPYVTATVA